jgi:hypothetical protein
MRRESPTDGPFFNFSMEQRLSLSVELLLGDLRQAPAQGAHSFVTIEGFGGQERKKKEGKK